MKGESVLYCGRIVPIEGFRTFVYGHNGTKKLVNSWTEFQEHIGSGVWFPTQNKAGAVMINERNIKKRRK